MGGLRFLARGPFIYILIKYTTMLSMIKPLPSSIKISLCMKGRQALVWAQRSRVCSAGQLSKAT